MLEVQLSPTANTFSKADLAFEAQAPKITNKVYSHSTTNFTNSNSDAGPQALNKSKTKLRALPVIDHNAQREKLQSIIGLCDIEEKPASTRNATKTQSIPPPK